MASLKLLLSRARRHCLSNPASTSSCSSPLHHLPKYFSSSSSSSPSESQPSPNDDGAPEPPERRLRRPQPVPIQPVSYAAKPKEVPPPSPETPAQHDAQAPPPPPREAPIREARARWTREDIRYMKDAPSISPVSYPMRVAPLPEDRASEDAAVEGAEAEKGNEGREKMEVERRRNEAANQAAVIRRRRLSRVLEEEEQAMVPFPMIIKAEKRESKAVYDLAEAIRLVKANARAKFDETIEAHVRLGIEKKRSDLIVRGSLVLPHGSGMKVSKVAFLGEGADADEARAAGADIVGGPELVEKIANSGGKFDVQKCFTTPGFMPQVLKIAKVLKPLGLLPNAKQGTLVSDVARAVREAKQSNVDFKMDKTSIVHVGLGKASLSDDDLRENIGAFVNALLHAKPAGLKKTSKYAGYVNSFHICGTMGPGFSVSIQSLSKAADHYTKVSLS
ncbi:50S ribosomal protein L1, chloroplastic isoform X2 [Rhodamnia argentea]|uniref:50S ribosomal protein L1, chloroplastic isoform X2 n=1 Tax=Rhodamnia argentea TaxID=178133 RepID=A0A8B8PUZ1_9MYRT|nr:50S ribosomal protein L1, chloroplastic isoform X2 [Rhodamnia argentea]